YNAELDLLGGGDTIDEASWQERHHATGEDDETTSNVDSSGKRVEHLQTALAQEFRALASLRHPHIISVLDYGFDDDDGQPYFTMELLLAVEPLRRASAGRCSRCKAVLVAELLRGLRYLRRHGIVYRGLKPDNVLVQDRDGTPRVKLLDFGIAQLHTAGRAALAGTIDYMAPELIKGDQPSMAADMYALGVMAYEMFAGTHPYLQAT